MSDQGSGRLHSPEMARIATQDGAAGLIEFVRGFEDGAQRLELWPLAWRELDAQGDFEEMVDIAEAVIDDALTQGEAAPDEESRRRLVDVAARMAYELSAGLADCWPGDTRPREMKYLETGLEAAQLCLKWSEELGKGPGALSIGWWAKGIHLLALSQDEEACEAFLQSLRLAEEDAAASGASARHDATGARSVLLAWGWLALARHRKGADDTELELVFAALDEAARARPEEAADLRGCADQIRWARERRAA